ncbi:thiolase C-terminal domain-containing protein [Pseudofrankia sp. BMG5.37]|uniref:thiolase C-terminal domain-containing protein n=1 Tax=Pseudofrankia sp. BMG5.37 TaxID=3050035 RepID=UPI0037C861EF
MTGPVVRPAPTVDELSRAFWTGGGHRPAPHHVPRRPRTAVIEGELPLNASGGQLSEGRYVGFGHLHEVCQQLRFWAGDRQMPSARSARSAAGVARSPRHSC